MLLHDQHFRTHNLRTSTIYYKSNIHLVEILEMYLLFISLYLQTEYLMFLLQIFCIDKLYRNLLIYYTSKITIDCITQ